MLAALLLGPIIVIKASTVVPATADLLLETFNDVTNYDDGLAGANSWAETTAGTTPTLDSNETVLCSTGTGWSSQCLENTVAGSNRKAYSMNDLGSARADAIYITYHMYMVAMTAWTVGQSHVLLGGTTTSAAIPGAASPFVATLEWDDDGVEGGESNCASGANLPACWRLRMRIGGGTSRAPEITVAANHNIRFKVDNGSAVGEAWLDGVQYLFTEQTSTDVQYIWQGIMEFSPAAESIVYDNTKVSTGGYVD